MAPHRLYRHLLPFRWWYVSFIYQTLSDRRRPSHASIIYQTLISASYVPAATLLFEWFQARRGLATGILYGGTGAGGAIFPLVVSALLASFGYKATMISLGLALIIIGHVCLVFIKRRIPIPRGETQKGRRHTGPKIDWSFMKRKVMLSGVVTILITSLGSFVPTVWLPSTLLSHPFTPAFSFPSSPSVINGQADFSVCERREPDQTGRNGSCRYNER